MSEDAREQYATPKHLGRRGSLHERYATIGWFGWVAERLSFPSGGRVLDVGCGPGWFWRSAAARLPAGIRLTLSDLSPGMVDAARTTLGADHAFASLDFVEADAATLPFPDASFDAVVSMHMIYHLSDPQAALREWHRVLRPDGRLFLTANGVGDLGSLHDLLHVFGRDGDEPVTSLLSLDEAEALVSERFSDVRREDCVQTYRIDDPHAVLLYLRSFPPGVSASPDEVAALERAIDDAFENDVLEAERRTGLISARTA